MFLEKPSLRHTQVCFHGQPKSYYVDNEIGPRDSTSCQSDTKTHHFNFYLFFINMGVLTVYLMCAVPVEAMGLDSLQLELQTVVSPMRVVGPEHWSSVRTASGLSH